MFTGIIEAKVPIKRATKKGRGLHIALPNPKGWRVAVGASVALDGICLTSIGKPGKDLEFELMGETLSKTTAGDFTTGRMVNLERPVRANGEIGGHFVQGHIDTRATVLGTLKRGWSQDLVIQIPARFTRLVAEVGSITINGVSLTVSRKRDARVTVSLIPHTLKHTNLGLLQKNDQVNVEFDVLARYLAALKER